MLPTLDIQTTIHRLKTLHPEEEPDMSVLSHYLVHPLTRNLNRYRRRFIPCGLVIAIHKPA